MASFIVEEIDSDILKDLQSEIKELHEASQQSLIELELTPDDNEMQRALFRSIHTIKGDLGLVGFVPMIEVLQYLEDILDLLRKGEIQFSSLLSDLVLQLLDVVQGFVNDCIDNGRAEYDKASIDKTIDVIKHVNGENSSKHNNLLKQAIITLAGGEIPNKQQDKSDIELAKTGIPKTVTESQRTDLLFFRELMRPIEKRCAYPEGRGDKIAALAFYINNLSDQKIDEAQLAVACFVHDFGLSFMPQHMVSASPCELSAIDQNLLRSHVYKSARLLENLSDWDEARKIIMQHHENMDGSGYPLGLKGDDICEGAKLIAILDRYMNLTTVSTESREAVPPKDAVLTVNKSYKGQLSGKWLRLFNQGMTKYLNQ